MMLRAVALLCVLLFVPTALAQILSGTDYRVLAPVADGGGTLATSADYQAALTITGEQQITQSGNIIVCFGYFCFTLEQVPSRAFVSFVLSLNITGPANDVARVDSFGPGFFAPAQLQRFYGCIEDAGISQTPAFGVVSAGAQLRYIQLQNSSEGSSIRVAEDAAGNRLLLPVTPGGCTSIANRLPLTGLLPFVPGAGAPDAIELFLSYPFTDIVGNFERSGKFSLVLEKNTTDQIVVEVV